MPQPKAQADAHKIIRSLSQTPTRQEILEAFDGASWDTFILLDEHPADFDADFERWHTILRQERNTPHSPLLDGLLS